MTITDLPADARLIPDIANLPLNTSCLRRDGEIVQFIGVVLPDTGDCYMFCPIDGRPFRVYASGRYIFDRDSQQDVTGYFL